MFNVESMDTAWNQLDKVYGDKGVICQKLKTKLKTLHPKSVDNHEIIIEIFNQMEYIVKRMNELGASALLQFDNDFWNCCYMVLVKLSSSGIDMILLLLLTSGMHFLPS